MIIVDTQINPIEQTDREINSEAESPKLYELNISITRHGPKDSPGGSLSYNGREYVLNYYRDEWQNPSLTSRFQKKVVSSPINRAKETADIFVSVLKEKNLFGPNMQVEVDDRLSEKDLVGFIEQLNPDQKRDWFREWYKSGLGKQAASDLAKWVMEKLNNQKESGNATQINAFSHGPVMAAFILRVEEILGQELLAPPKSEQDRLSLKRLFLNPESQFDYLGNINLSFSSSIPDFAILKLSENPVSIPIEILNRI